MSGSLPSKPVHKVSWQSIKALLTTCAVFSLYSVLFHFLLDIDVPPLRAARWFYTLGNTPHHWRGGTWILFDIIVPSYLAGTYLGKRIPKASSWETGVTTVLFSLVVSLIQFMYPHFVSYWEWWMPTRIIEIIGFIASSIAFACVVCGIIQAAMRHAKNEM